MFEVRTIAARSGFAPAPGDVAPSSAAGVAIPSLRPQRVWPRSVGGAALALLALAIVGRQALSLDWRAVWLRLAAANLWLLAAAAVIFWLTAIVRTLR